MKVYVQLQTSDKEFLEQALLFYKNIDKYCSLLGIEDSELEAFRNDMNILLFVADNRFKSFTESFVRYNITTLRNKLEHLFITCVNSKKYTSSIGTKLGIVIPQHNVSWPDSWGHSDILTNWRIGPGLKYS